MKPSASGRHDRSLKDGMAIVLIEWSIEPNEAAVSLFIEYWRTKLAIDDKSGLFGEFLSAPVPVDEVSLPVWVDDLSASDPKVPMWKFVNVGLWESRATFSEQIGHLMTDERQDFEAAPRRRIVLEPQEWRRGSWNDLPPATCD